MDILLDHFHRLVPWAFAGLLLGAAWSDVRSYLIPNRLSLLSVLLYPAYAFTAPQPVDVIGAVIVGSAVLAVTGGLFAADLMGGGDVKLMVATALWAGVPLVLPFLLITAIVGGALSLVALARLRIGTASGRAIAAPPQRVPYGVAIAAGGLYVAARLLGL